jgi:hypothetical protein
MAFTILGIMPPYSSALPQVEPIWADLNGGMDRLPDLADITHLVSAQNSTKKLIFVVQLHVTTPLASKSKRPSKLSMFFHKPISALIFLPLKAQVLCKT